MDRAPSEEDVSGATSLLYDVSLIRTSYGSGASGSWRPEAGAHAIPLQELSHGGLQDEEEITFPGGECRIVLMGKTGNGKSSTGNSIVGTERFVVGGGMASQTKRCQWHNCIRFGIKIEVVDTPGFFDTHDDDVEVRKEVMRCVGMVSPGPHALLLVVRLDARFTPEEENSVKEVRNLFGDKVMRHVIIIFTHGDSLNKDLSETEAVQKGIKDAPAALHKILQDVDRRYVVFNNRASPADKKGAVRELLLTIRGMLSSTEDQPYNTPFLQQCEQAVMSKATQLGDLLDSKTITNKHLRDLIRGGLEGRERLEEILHQVLDQQQRTEDENRKLRKSLEQSQAQARALQDQLVQTLNNKKPLRICSFL